MERRKLVGFHLLHLFFHTTLLLYSLSITIDSPVYPSVRLPYKWSNSKNLSCFLLAVVFLNSSHAPEENLAYCFGFYPLQLQPLSSVLGVFVSPNVLLWSANRDRAVGRNATVEFTNDGDLVLRDADGSSIWSTNTSGMSIARMNLTEFGNLQLLDATNRTVWQSFDYPTNVLLPGQNLTEGRTLTANASASNVSSGPFSFSHTQSGFKAFRNSNPPKLYGELQNFGMQFYSNGYQVVNFSNKNFIFASSSNDVFIRLDHDGHLRIYIFVRSLYPGWSRLSDLTIDPNIQSPPPSDTPRTSSTAIKPIIVGVVCGLGGILLITLGFGILVYRKKRSNGEEDDEEDPEDKIGEFPNMPKKFTYEFLRFATVNFSIKLGGGGFGWVFDGTLLDGVRVAVKKLDSVHQGKKEFVAEVSTIGSIHHLNLVKLIGFCVQKSHRLLVYEHMMNGSLDSWIFTEKHVQLSWELRRRIIHDVARGLSYLHEACRQKIAHLDIKPQNILLDSDFNAKISDFGLAKLIDRDKSAVLTVMRGTRGYIAPEWVISHNITEKVDVYSFGVVIAEIVCRMRNFDHERKNPDGTPLLLLPILEEKCKSGQLLDLVDSSMELTPSNSLDMEKMLMLAVWCLQYDPYKRPSMSVVVKVLEGEMEITKDMNYDFRTPVESMKVQLMEEPPTSTPSWALELSSTR